VGLFGTTKRSESPSASADDRETPAPPDPIEPRRRTFIGTGALGPILGGLTSAEMPTTLQPKDDPSRDKVFDDEIDPSWRDPDTSGQ
jgi:hypothetical protein